MRLRYFIRNLDITAIILVILATSIHTIALPVHIEVQSGIIDNYIGIISFCVTILFVIVVFGAFSFKKSRKLSSFILFTLLSIVLFSFIGANLLYIWTEASGWLNNEATDAFEKFYPYALFSTILLSVEGLFILIAIILNIKYINRPFFDLDAIING